MCFAPYISLSTCIIEFILALYFLLKNPKDKLNLIISLISFLLGLYQLNEFLICITGLNLFTKLARIITVILPALGISYTLIMSRKKVRWYWNILIYAPALFFILMFALTSYLSQSAFCSTVFIQYPDLGLLGKFFGLYYLLYLCTSVVIFYFTSSKITSIYERRLLHLGMLGFFIFTVPTYIFLLFLPSLKIQFPSILCEFALLLAIEFTVVIWYKEKHKLHY
jgi:hypothetical protein